MMCQGLHAATMATGRFCLIICHMERYEEPHPSIHFWKMFCILVYMYIVQSSHICMYMCNCDHMTIHHTTGYVQYGESHNNIMIILLLYIKYVCAGYSG